MRTLLTGKVIRGDGLGKKLRHPTANIDCTPPEAFEDGVYAAIILWGSDRYDGIVVVGDKHRDNKPHKKVEFYLLDFEGDLYGQKLSAEIIEKIRPFEKFASTEALIQRIEADCRVARDILKKLRRT